MKLQFNIKYATRWGEELRVRLSLIGKHSETVEQTCLLHTHDGMLWSGDIEIGSAGVLRFRYTYELYDDGKLSRREWDVVPRVFLASVDKEFEFNDCWHDIPELSHRFSSAFTECVMRRDDSVSDVDYEARSLVLRVLAPQLNPSENLYVVGGAKQLGGWDVAERVAMKRTSHCQWTVCVNAFSLSTPFEYKYIAVDKDGNVKWESGYNRYINALPGKTGKVTVVDDGLASFNVPRWHGAGIVIPVFSLRSEQSWGVGDFGDLRHMVEWASKVGMKAVQILPINDTSTNGSWQDSYPYNSISIYAFHPQYADLNSLPALKDKRKMQEYGRKRLELNALHKLDYEKVNKLKTDYLHDVYLQEKKKAMSSEGYRQFFANNSHWLKPYAAFRFLCYRYGTADFSNWDEYRQYKPEMIDGLCKAESEEIEFYYYVQYVLHSQLVEVSRCARKNGVILKGDIPIGISRCGVETWSEPHYFNMNGQAGAPPDDFSVNGQNWGFPTYKWDVMMKDGCQWWARRFSQMAQYFDAYRIDHILGFFRIWEIPLHSVHGLLGQFSPSLPMTVEEIESYGLKFRSEEFTKPYITDSVLDSLFGVKATEVGSRFLAKEGERYALLPEFDTQRKIETYFREKNIDDAQLRDGLYSLVSNVLFVEDNSIRGVYHPRIAVQTDYVFGLLTKEEKDAFNKLYDDYYYRRHNSFWYEKAMQKLPMLTSVSRMLVCGEDLGMVPESVPWVMNQLHILSLEIQSMPKKYGCRFGCLAENPYMSVATISTHDMETFRGWWSEDHERAQQYYTEVLHRGGDAPVDAPGWLCEQVVSEHLRSDSVLCLLSFQDWMSIDEKLRYPDSSDERINIPSNPRHYWRYRMHLTLEQLDASVDFCRAVRRLIESSGR